MCARVRVACRSVGGGGIGQYGLWTVWSYWSVDDDYVVGLYTDHVSRRDCYGDECEANIYSKKYTEGFDSFEPKNGKRCKVVQHAWRKIWYIYG